MASWIFCVSLSACLVVLSNGQSCSKSRDCAANQCCRNSQTNSVLVNDPQGPFETIIGEGQGQCVSGGASPGDMCDSHCQCPAGYECYRKITGACCAPRTCITIAQANADRDYWRCRPLPPAAPIDNNLPLNLNVRSFKEPTRAPTTTTTRAPSLLGNFMPAPPDPDENGESGHDSTATSTTTARTPSLLNGLSNFRGNRRTTRKPRTTTPTTTTTEVNNGGGGMLNSFKAPTPAPATTTTTTRRPSVSNRLDRVKRPPGGNREEEESGQGNGQGRGQGNGRGRRSLFRSLCPEMPMGIVPQAPGLGDL